MKCLLIVVVFLTSLGAGFSQDYYLVGGLNLSNHVKNTFDTDGLVNSDFRPGFHLGVVGVTPLSERFFVETGVIFDQKGSVLEVERKLTTSTIETVDKLFLYYLDVPFRIGYKMAKRKEFTILFSSGLYCGMALFARGVYKTKIQNHEFEEKYSLPWSDLFGSKRYNYLDYGLTGNLGVAYKKFQLQLSYSKGLANLALARRFNHCLKLSLRYQLK